MSASPRPDVTGDYLALRRECGLIEGQHELLMVTGPAAVSWLDGLLSQHLEPLPVGGVARSLLLDPKGRLLSAPWILRGEQEVGLVVESGSGRETAAELQRFRLRVEAEMDPAVSPAAELWGPKASEVLAQAGLAVPDGWARSGAATVARAPLGSLPRFFVWGADPEALVAAGARPVEEPAATAVRVEAGEPRLGRDVPRGAIPHESGLVPAAVSFDKGCFVGYELVERIESRGRMRATLRGVEITRNVLPPEGAEVTDGERVLGTMTSVAESLTLRAPVGLAVLRTDAAPGAEVEVRWEGGDVPGIVRELPMDDFAEAAGPGGPGRTV